MKREVPESTAGTVAMENAKTRLASILDLDSLTSTVRIGVELRDGLGRIRPFDAYASDQKGADRIAVQFLYCADPKVAKTLEKFVKKVRGFPATKLAVIHNFLLDPADNAMIKRLGMRQILVSPYEMRELFRAKNLAEIPRLNPELDSFSSGERASVNVITVHRKNRKPSHVECEILATIIRNGGSSITQIAATCRINHQNCLKLLAGLIDSRCVTVSNVGPNKTLYEITPKGIETHHAIENYETLVEKK